MGGKNKKAERTKDNARPSSSSHCAELLGNNVPIFCNFSTAKDTFFGGPEEFNINIDVNFHIVLKKMTKKDSVTKLKALQEFTSLCKNSDSEAVKTVLPFWPRLYCSLATDVEHRVREAVHVAHAAIVEKVKKSMAPYLKQIAGPWFTSQYDNYPPAASAATLSFEQAFPSEKLNKVLIFCQGEILSYIYESLIKHTPQTISNSNTMKPEELDAKYQRIVIASLQGYNFYLQKVTEDQIKETEESNRKIVSSPKFWEYSKNKVALIRNSFFNVLISLCQNAKFLLTNEMRRVTVAIFNDLDDSDPMVMTCVWDAALNALVFLEDCWAHVSLEKQVFPKLNSIIKKGGRNAITIFPSILPLLSKIPADLIKDKTEFYGKLLHNIRLVMEGSNAMNSGQAASKTIAVTFIECLNYIVVQYSADITFCRCMVSDYLLPALEKQLSTPKLRNSSISTALFSETSILLRSWHSVLPPKREFFDNILTLFWESLLRICKKAIEEEPSCTTVSEILNNHMELLKMLQNSNSYMFRPKKRIRFLDSVCDEKEVAEVEKENIVDNSEFARELLRFAKRLAALYLENAVQDENNAFIPNLSEIVNLFDSKVVLEEFITVQKETCLYSLFCNLFCNWLENPRMRRGEIVDLSFSLLKYLKKEEKETILQKFCKDWSSNDLQYDICRSLLNYSKDESVRSWILSEVFSKHLLDMTRNFVDSKCEDEISRNIITVFFKDRNDDEECTIGAVTASAIMDILSANIRYYDGKNHVRELAQDLIVSIDPKKTQCLDSFEELTIALFKLSCYYDEDEKLRKACDFALSTVVTIARRNFTERLANATKEIIFNSHINFSLDIMISRINYFIKLSSGSDLSERRSSNADIEAAVNVVKHFLDEPAVIAKSRKRMEWCCTIGYQSVGLWDIKFVELKERNNDTTDCEISLTDLLKKLIVDFNKSHNWSSDSFKQVLCYYQAFSDFKYKGSSPETLVKAQTDISPEVIIIFAKWTIYTGNILNLLMSGHPKCYKTSVLQETWNPYVINEQEAEAFRERHDTHGILPIKVTAEELNGLKTELIRSQEFSGVDYEEKINVMSLVGEILDLVLSVGFLISFGSYYVGTKYHQILKKYTKELKRVSRELFMNSTMPEYLFFYKAFLHFTSEVAKWRMIKPVLQDQFSRTFMEREEDLEAEYVSSFVKSNLISQPVKENTLLKLWYIIQHKYAFQITGDEWNSIFIYLHKFFEGSNLDGNISENDVTTISLLSRIAVHLMKSFQENHLKPIEERLSPDACLAWNEVVKVELWNRFFHVWQKLAAKWHDQQITPEVLIALHNISDVVTSSYSPSQIDVTDNVKLGLEYINYIKSPYTVFQVTSFRLLQRLVPEWVKLDTETFCQNLSKITEDMKEGSFKTSSKCDWTCKHLETVISSNQGIVETLLSDFVIGDCCSVEPFTDSFNYTFSYLLLWCFLLEMCGEAHSSLRFQYGFWLRERGYTSSLLVSLFKLMPQAVIHGSELKENCQKYFEKYVTPSLKEPVTSERIEQISCFVYRIFLQRLPNIIREWWSQSENKTSTLVDKVTSLYVSPLLITSELKSVQQDRDGGFDNMEIKIHPNAREVIATYTIDDVKMDLVMTLPQNYPLGTIKIESSNVVVSNSSRRNWLFHISKYLIHQNGSIWEALVMWKSNLDKKFEGVEECYICASILQGSTFETPRVCCKICKKKFHSHCLYKWFSTSNNSSCPICRNLF